MAALVPAPYRRLAPYLRGHVSTLGIGACLALVVAAMDGATAWLVKPAMDDVFLRRDVTMLWLVPAALLAVYLVKGLARYGQSYLMASVGERIVARLRGDVYGHLQDQPLAFFSGVHSADLVSRLLNDVQRVARIGSTVLVMAVRQVATILALLAVMLAREPALTLAALVAFPLVGVLVRTIGRRLYRINRRFQQRIGDLAVLLQEAFAGMKIVKAYGRETHERQRFDDLNRRLLHLSLRNARTDEVTEPLMEVLGAIGIGVALLWGGWRVVHGVMTPGTFFSFTAAVIMLYGPVRRLARAFNAVHQSTGAVERIFELLDVPPAVVDRAGAPALAPFRDALAFENVGFRYPDADGPVLRDITLTVRRGEIVAFVGLSGAGKSTLLDLLPRFHDVTAGRITIDGRDLRTVTQASLRAQIGLVTQDTLLFSETIGYNIAYGAAGAGAAAVERAARLAHAHDFIAACPQGYDTPIGERGVRLSGGQRQRIAIARAFLKDPPILILDEATSDLDAESEAHIQAALADLVRGRTVLVIAHRLATIRRADRIVVVHDGRIAEVGSHTELVARDGLYRRLHALQAAP